MVRSLLADRVAFYLPLLSGGGAERVMVELANGFAKRGVQIDLVLAKAEGPYLKDVSGAVRLIDLGSRQSPIVPRSLPALTRYLARERPRVMLSAMTYTSVVAVLARKLAGVNTRLFVGEHNALSMTARHSSRRSERWKPFFLRWSYPRLDGVIAVSHGVAEDLSQVLGYPREQIRVIYNPVVTPTLLARASETVAHPWFRPGEPPVIIGVGRLTKQKDFPNLIRAFSLLRAQRKVRLMILGEGELRGELEAMVESLALNDDVSLPGFVDNPFAYMRNAAVFALSSRWEGLPTVLIEAMACGTPVVSTDCPYGPAEILEHGRWGRLVPVNDPAALAAAIGEALDDPDVARGSERAGDFVVDRAVQLYLAAFGLDT